MTHQLDVWKGAFGQAYTDRNQEDWQLRVEPWREMLRGLSLERVLEVGCNRGSNLRALAEVLGDGPAIVGIEPNPYALQLARAASNRIGVLSGDAFELPFKDGYFDLAFTAGVLIHIALPDLHRALAEIYRVSRRYVLAIEYFDEAETVIPYRGHEDLLWKRNFLKAYQEQFPDLSLRRSGYWEKCFDRSHWWLLEKRR